MSDKRERITIEAVKNAMKRTGQAGLPLQARLFLLLLMFLLTLMLAIFIILLITGTFQTGLQENQSLLANELYHISTDIYKSYGDLSVQSVTLAQSLSDSLEQNMKKCGVVPAQLSQHPDILEQLLDAEVGRLTGALERGKSSGVFVILDATVNPALAYADYSRAGLFIKNMEPNILSASAPNILLLRGPASVASRNNINIHSQWAMEFDVQGADYFTMPIQEAQKSELPLSRLYYWCPNIVLPNTNEASMFCAVPLIASDGTVFGVCGLDVSAMLFKLAFTPDNSTYNRIFCMLAPLSEGTLDPVNALFAGNYSISGDQLPKAPIPIKYDSDSFNIYGKPEETPLYAGMHTTVQLYPSNSAFVSQQWAVALIMPEEDLNQRISAQRRNLFLLLLLLLLISIGGCALVSRKSMKPVIYALNLIKSQKLSEVPKTRIPEIDDLIEFLSAQDEESRPESEKPGGTEDSIHSSALFREFMENVKTLSVAERAVFDLYLKGHTAKEIADILCLSINTIKTHNKRIYMKLNVASRKELLLYVRMMEEGSGPLQLKEE